MPPQKSPPDLENKLGYKGLGYMGAIDPAPYFPRHIFNTDINLGDESNEVKFLQDFLIMHGFLSPIPSAQYGIYGHKTREAVALFQTTFKVASAWTLFWNNGKYVGPMTRYYLNTL